MASREEISKAHVTIEGNIKPLEDAVQKANEEVEKVGEAADNAGAKVDQSFAKAGDRIEKSTAGVRKFVGALSSVAGVATGVLGVVGLLTGAFMGLVEVLKRLNGSDGDGLKEATENLEKFFDTASGKGKALQEIPVFQQLEEQIKSVQEQLNELQLNTQNADPDYFDNFIEGAKTAGQAIANVGTGGVAFLDEFADPARRAQIEALREELGRLLVARQEFVQAVRQTEGVTDGLIGEEAVERFRKLQETAGAFLDNLRSQSESLRVSLIGDDEQRIRAETDLLLEQMDRVRQGLGISADNQDLQNYIDLIRAGEAEKLKALNDRLDLEKRAAEEARQALIQAGVDAANAQANQLEERLRSISNADFVTDLQSVVKALGEMTGAVRRLKQ